jgi:hypothetical protein
LRTFYKINCLVGLIVLGGVLWLAVMIVGVAPHSDPDPEFGRLFSYALPLLVTIGNCVLLFQNAQSWLMAEARLLMKSTLIYCGLVLAVLVSSVVAEEQVGLGSFPWSMVLGFLVLAVLKSGLAFGVLVEARRSGAS